MLKVNYTLCLTLKYSLHLVKSVPLSGIIRTLHLYIRDNQYTKVMNVIKSKHHSFSELLVKDLHKPSTSRLCFPTSVSLFIQMLY